MPESQMLWIACPIGFIVMAAADWLIGHPLCKSCGNRVKRLAEKAGVVTAQCPKCGTAGLSA